MKETSAAQLPLVPVWLLVTLWFIALTIPNLVYSGMSWYDTLHIVKWAVAAIPLGIAALVAGARLAIFGRKRMNLRIDLFGTLWMALLTYVTAQAVWVDISSRTGFIHELFCFAAVWFFYVISWNSFPDRAIRPLLWLANISAAVNVVFAELQMRGLNEFQIFGFDGFNRIILPTPGNYIGNTGQQNMFGLWLAVCVMSSIYLYIAYADTHSGKKRHPAVTALNIALMLVNMWGLLNSTSRSAVLSLLVGLAFLVLITLRQFDSDYVRRLTHVGVLFVLVVLLSGAINYDRAIEMTRKFIDMLIHPETIGGRFGIWATSLAMFMMYPVSGVGIGQYKWHYLEAQREAFNFYPELKWQYTHWAHNEFLQWFCEGGLAGGLLLLAMWLVWCVFLVRMLWRRERVAREVIWACALVALVSFNAFWTRPFHRIENILWLSLAFAVSNRAMIAALAPKKAFALEQLTRVCGVVFCVVGVCGLFYLGNGMAGDRMIREALASPDPEVSRDLLQKAADHLMVREAAIRELGYYYMRIADALNMENDEVKISDEVKILADKLLEEKFMSLSDELDISAGGGYTGPDGGEKAAEAVRVKIREDYIRPLDAKTKALHLQNTGYDIIWNHFKREPHTNEMGFLITWSQEFQDIPTLETLASYLEPGTYRLEVYDKSDDER